jgi:hypothetical protein
MTSMTGSRRARLVAAACAVLISVTAGCSAAEEDRSEVAAAPATTTAAASPMVATSEVPKPRDGWQTVEYRNVQVDVPADWVRVDTGKCEFQSVQWAPAGLPPCRMTAGVVFYGAATFDPAHGPGVRKGEGKTWSGYVFAGDLAVYSAGTDRELVQEVLDTARPPRQY